MSEQRPELKVSHRIVLERMWRRWSMEVAAIRDSDPAASLAYRDDLREKIAACQAGAAAIQRLEDMNDDAWGDNIDRGL